MERKECNAEGKASACQIPCFISAMFYKIFTQKSIHIKCYYLQKRKSFQKRFFESKLKNIAKGVRSTKFPVVKLYTFETILFTHISC